MIQEGKVKSLIGNTAIVTVKRKSACGDGCSGCLATCKMPSVDLKIDAVEGLSVDDWVEITSEEVNVLKYCFILYGVPLIIMLAVILLASLIFKGDSAQLYSGLCGIASLGLSYFILKKYDEKEASKKNLKHKIVRIINN